MVGEAFQAGIPVVRPLLRPSSILNLTVYHSFRLPG